MDTPTPLLLPPPHIGKTRDLHLCQLPCSFLLFTRTFHVKSASLGNICKENDDCDLPKLVICHSEIHFRS